MAVPSFRPVAACAGLLAAALLGACDFTPTLDIDTPEHEARTVLRAILAADSVAVVRVGRSWDPYEGRPVSSYGQRPETPTARVTLLRDGQPVETLAIRSETCEDYSRGNPYTDGPRTYECGPYAGSVPVEAGGTYTIRAEVEGLPVAEGTVTVPLRPDVSVEEEAVGADEARRFRIRLRDAAGKGDRYGLSLFSSRIGFRSTECDGDGVCRDTSGVFEADGRYPLSFETSDPVLLAAAREIPGEGIEFVTVTDETFDGREWAFSIVADPRGRYVKGVADGPLAVQLAALSTEIFDAYQISHFSLGDDNPFAEPANLPSNVEGGYGIVGAVAVVEVAVPARDGE